MKPQFSLRIPSYRQVIEHFTKKGLDPRDIALALAVGNFVGILPFLGLHTVLGIAVAHIMGLNQLVVFLGAQVSNPLSFPFILVISAQIGSLILNGSFLELKLHDVSIIRHYLFPTLLGSVILGLSVGSVSYFAAMRILKKGKA